jgi:hypothetical protein
MRGGFAASLHCMHPPEKAKVEVKVREDDYEMK